MTNTTWASIVLSAAAVLTPLIVAPVASADDTCPSGVSGTVCQGTEGPDVAANPPQVVDGAQNGPYGPAGDNAPVGGNGL